MGAPDGSISIDINNNLMNKINKNLEELPAHLLKEEKFTIFRVPALIRQKFTELYEPRIVSIGPYYNGNDALRAMEKHKWRYLRDYLSRNKRNNLEHCISELRRLESQVRRCYFEDVNLKSDEFVMMLLLDGCFIIEFLIKWYSDPDQFLDTILNVGWVLPIIRSDLLLLENQIPFFVIQKLFCILTCSCSSPFPVQQNVSGSTPVVPKIEPLLKMLVEYLSEGGKKLRPFHTPANIKHILHLYHLCYVPSVGSNEHSPRTYSILGCLNPMNLLIFFLTCIFRRTKLTNGELPLTIPSATELVQAGVIFKCSQSKNILDIKFQNGTLEIPSFCIDETHKTRLLSLLYFEQTDDNNLKKNMTCYANFMDTLFKTTTDVTLLQEKEIVQNLLATNEELVSFFNWLTVCAALDYESSDLKNVVKNVNKHYKDDWNRWKAILRRDYFSNPWSTISFTVAFLLLAFTTLQTIYTIISYY